MLCEVCSASASPALQQRFRTSVCDSVAVNTTCRIGLFILDRNNCRTSPWICCLLKSSGFHRPAGAERVFFVHPGSGSSVGAIRESGSMTPALMRGTFPASFAATTPRPGSADTSLHLPGSEKPDPYSRPRTQMPYPSSPPKQFQWQVPSTRTTPAVPESPDAL